MVKELLVGLKSGKTPYLNVLCEFMPSKVLKKSVFAFWMRGRR
jgi:hypothetical protein